jgi:hypothetical protein
LGQPQNQLRASDVEGSLRRVSRWSEVVAEEQPPNPFLPEPAPLEPRQVTCQPYTPQTPADQLGTNIEPPAGELPIDCTAEALRRDAADRGQFFGLRDWEPTLFHWAASELCHEPLYFEELMLERYGHSMCCPLQPVISSAHFFATLPVLPYKMGLDPAHCAFYDLGFERPGSCAPNLAPRVPLTWRAAASQGLFTTGLVFFIP